VPGRDVRLDAALEPVLAALVRSTGAAPPGSATPCSSQTPTR
jgi:hypothetical protein